MNNVQRFRAAAATVLALGTSTVQAEGFPVPLSPTNPNSNPATTLVVPVQAAPPTNPKHRQNNALFLRPTTSTLVAQASQASQASNQVAQGDEQPSTELSPNYGAAGAAAIVELQKRIDERNRIIKQDDQNSATQLQQNRDRFQQFLRNRQQSQ